MNEIKPSNKIIRVLPPVIEEAITHGFDIVLNKHGYLVEGFYGMLPFEGDDAKKFKGHALLVASNKEDILLAIDPKGKKHPIANFDDLIKFNHHVWKHFVKEEPYKIASQIWFSHLYNKGMLEISPKK